jgi:site-specific recombinase XerD
MGGLAMNNTPSFAVLLEHFFTQRLMSQRRASPHTIGSYRDTFRLLLQFAHKRLHKTPSALALTDLDASLIGAFLDDVQKARANSARSRNLRLTAIRSFFRYAAFEMPAASAMIQRVLAIPNQRYEKKLVAFLTRVEILALLNAPNQHTWSGRRDHALLLLAVQTGLRLSELTSLRRADIVLGIGAHVRCMGKGRKERCTPLMRRTANALKAWLAEPIRGRNDFVFPNARGGQLTNAGVQYLVAKHMTVARRACPSLHDKAVSPHVLRHTAAMELLQAGVDRSTIALWLGHESVETTQIYLDANLAIKEEALAKTTPLDTKPRRYRANDKLLEFLAAL